MARIARQRKPYKPPSDDEVVERLVPIPGWVYNLMTARAAAQKRTTKYQISFELERLAEKMRSEGTGDKELGNRMPDTLTI